MSRYYLFTLLFLSSFRAYSIGLNFNDVADQSLLRQVTTIEILYALQPHVNWEQPQAYWSSPKLNNGNDICIESIQNFTSKPYQNTVKCEQKPRIPFAMTLFNKPQSLYSGRAVAPR